MEYLYNDTPKLFRSTPEGTVLVRLMNISLTPEQTLGRMLYNFSATAYEIGEVNSENLLKTQFFVFVFKYEPRFKKEYEN